MGSPQQKTQTRIDYREYPGFRTLCSLYKLWGVPERPSLSEWCDANLIVTGENAEPGPWVTDEVPYLREPMNGVSSGVNHTVYVGPSQSAKTYGMNFAPMMYFICVDPCTMLYVLPDEDFAKDISKERLSVLIDEMPEIRKKIIPAKEKTGTSSILKKFYPGGNLVMAGANVPAKLSSRPRKVVIIDEPDQFKPSAAGQGDPMKIAFARTKTFRENKTIIETGSPTIKGRSRIEKSYGQSSQGRFHVPCPKCDTFQELIWRNFDFESVKVRCTAEGCRSLFTKQEWLKKWQKRGKWVHEHPNRPMKGYWLSGMYQPWMTWHEIKWEFIEANKLAIRGDVEQLKVCINTTLGELWEEKGDSIDEDLYKMRREIYTSRLPDGVKVLTAGIDVQKDRIHYEVVGWGAFRESWGIQTGVLWGDPTEDEIWDRLDKILLEGRWEYSDGRKARVRRAFIDSQGLYTTRTYRYTKMREPWCFSIRGVGGENKDIIISFEKDKKYLAVFFNLGVDTIKQHVFAKLRVAPGTPGFWHFPKQENEEQIHGYNENYFAELVGSEYMMTVLKKGFEKLEWNKRSHTANEGLDIRVYAMAAVQLLVEQGKSLETMERDVIEDEIAPPEPKDRGLTPLPKRNHVKYGILTEGIEA